MIDLGYHNNG